MFKRKTPRICDHLYEFQGTAFVAPEKIKQSVSGTLMALSTPNDIGNVVGKTIIYDLCQLCGYVRTQVVVGDYQKSVTRDVIIEDKPWYAQSVLQDEPVSPTIPLFQETELVVIDVEGIEPKSFDGEITSAEFNKHGDTLKLLVFKTRERMVAEQKQFEDATVTPPVKKVRRKRG